MTDSTDDRPDAPDVVPTDLPSDLEARLPRLDEAELRAVITYTRTLLPELPDVRELLEERPGEEILDVEELDNYTKVVKTQPRVDGCEGCPHGPYVYHVRVEKHPDDGPSLHWTLVGPVQQ